MAKKTTERTFAWCNAETWLRHNTHGHVVKHVRGLLARCGGPAICQVCRVEEQLKSVIDESRTVFDAGGFYK